jgi:hypothetical protein
MLSAIVLVGMTIAIVVTIAFFGMQLWAGFRQDRGRARHLSLARSISFLVFTALAMLSPDIRTALKFVFLFVFIMQGIAVLLEFRTARRTDP